MLTKLSIMIMRALLKNGTLEATRPIVQAELNEALHIVGKDWVPLLPKAMVHEFKNILAGKSKLCKPS